MEAKTPLLSQKEQEVVSQLCKGLTNEQIAAKLNLSVNTIKTHLKHIYKKYRVHSRSELIVTILKNA